MLKITSPFFLCALMFAIVSLEGCQTAKVASPTKTISLPEPAREKKVIAAPVETYRVVIRYNSVPVKTSAEAREVLQNRRSFLRDFFHNSFDPYFGQPRWSDACLAQNRLGDLQEKGDAIVSQSELTTDENFNVGNCAPEHYRATLIDIYCAKSSAVIEAFVRQETRESPFPTQMRIRCQSPIQLELQ